MPGDGHSHDGDAHADPLPPRYARSASKSQPRSTPATERAPRARSPDSRPIHHPRETFYVKKYMELDQYMKDFRSFRHANLTLQEKVELYGSPVAPIFVPLARGESITDYEARFDEWLARKGLTRRELETDPNPRAERNQWYEFAYANAKGKEKYDPTKNYSSNRKRQRSSELEDLPQKKATRETKDIKDVNAAKTDTKPDPEKGSKLDSGKAQGCTMVPPRENAPRTEVIAAYVACGCQRCLLKGIWHMSRKVSEVEAKMSSQSKCSCGQTGASQVSGSGASKAQVVEEDPRRSPRSRVPLSRPTSVSRDAAAITKLVLARPSPAELVALTSSAVVRRDPVQVDEDPVEKQLASEYDEINEQVIMNENVLEASAARLATTPVTDIQETTRLQDENLELRGFVQEEVENRNAALAMLVVYVWRHDRGSLEKMISDRGVSDVIHVQRMGHQKCELLAKQIVGKHELMASIKSQLEAAMDSNEDDRKRLAKMTELGGKLGTTELALKTLRSQRQREFATLVHFDDHLRLLIKTLLETAPL